MFKKKSMEQYEMGFFKVIRQAGLFVEGLDLNLLDPFKDVKDEQLLNEDDMANVQVVLLFIFLCFIDFVVVLAL